MLLVRQVRLVLREMLVRPVQPVQLDLKVPLALLDLLVCKVQLERQVQLVKMVHQVRRVQLALLE